MDNKIKLGLIGMVCLLMVYLLGLVVFVGCSSVVNVANTAATTTTTAATTTTSTTATSTTTSTLLIGGMISNYGGSQSEIGVEVFKEWGEVIGVATASVSGSQAVYSIEVPSAGYYFLYAYDYDGEDPSAGNWVGGSGWTGISSVENSGSLNLALFTNITSVEAPTSSANFPMHEIVTPEGVAVSATLNYPADGPENELYVVLFKTSVLTSAAGMDSKLNIYSLGIDDEVSPGDVVTIEVVGVADDQYYAIVSDEEDAYIGAYGWAGTAEVDVNTIILNSGALWQNITSFEVSGSDVNLGVVSLHPQIGEEEE